MKRMAACSLALAIPLIAGAERSFAKCDFNASPDQQYPGNGVSIRLTLEPGSYGTIARPDAEGGSSTISITPDGTRIIPPNLVIKSDMKDINRMPKAVSGVVTGGAGCSFRITLISMDGLSGVRLAPAQGYALSSPNSGASGVLDATGQFRFNVGFTTSVLPLSTSSSLRGTIALQVDYN